MKQGLGFTEWLNILELWMVTLQLRVYLLREVLRLDDYGE